MIMQGNYMISECIQHTIAPPTQTPIVADKIKWNEQIVMARCPRLRDAEVIRALLHDHRVSDNVVYIIQYEE